MIKKLTIDYSKKYIISRTINIIVSDNSKFVIYNSQSRPLKEVNLDLLLILNTFLEVHTFDEAFNIVSEIYNISKKELKIIVTQFINLNIITLEELNSSKVALAEEGFASLSSHHLMLSDTIRVMAYKLAIAAQVKNKRVLEIGCGTGVLSIFAAKAGAKHVTAIEESKIAEVAKQMFISNNTNHVTTLIHSNSKDVILKEKADIIIHEIIGHDPLDENILVFIEDAKKRLLKKDGIFIPNKFEVCCVAFDLDINTQIKDEAKLYGELYGVNFDEFVKQVNESTINKLFKTTPNNNNSLLNKKIISEELVLNNIDFNNFSVTKESQSKKLKLKIIDDGLLSGVLIYFKAHLGSDVVLSTSPFSHPTHWGQKYYPFETHTKVSKNTTINLSYEITTSKGKQIVELKIV